MGRQPATASLTVVGALLLLLGIVAGYLNRTVLDSDTFADRADMLRSDPAVSRALGRALADAYLDRTPDAVAIRPLLDAVATSVAGSDVLSAPTRVAARSLQRSLTEPNSNDIVLRFADTGSVLAGVLAGLAPDRAPAPTGQVSLELARIGGQSYTGRALRLAVYVRVSSWLLPLAGVALMAAGVVLARDRRRRLLAGGLALMSATAVAAVGLAAGGLWAASHDTEAVTDVLVRQGWGVFVLPVWHSLAGLALLGALVTAAAASPAADLEPVGALRAAWRYCATRPSSSAVALIRALLVILAGIAAVLRPSQVGLVTAILPGAWLILFGVRELGVVTRRPATSSAGPPGLLPLGRGAAPAAHPRRGTGWRSWWAGGSALAVLMLLVGWGAVPVSSAADGAGTDGTGQACNGDVRLCTRRFTDVAYPASHNAMSQATDRSWFIPEQGLTLSGQLDLGVRALLVDVWLGYPTQGGRVATARAAYGQARAAAESDLGPEAVAAGLRVFDAVADPAPAGPERLYMCHGLCEIGASDFVAGMEQVRSWLQAHPREVLTIIVENHADPARVGAALDQAGLAQLAFTPPPAHGPWPTLGELVSSGRRVLVMLEEGDGGGRYPWLGDGYAGLLQETPYTFRTATDFSCLSNRGRLDAPLFLVNHWLANFDHLVSSAQAVNADGVLGVRAQTCREQRRFPNYLAVNYADIGDAIAVVRRLNGLDGP